MCVLLKLHLLALDCNKQKLYKNFINFIEENSTKLIIPVADQGFNL